ncbi:MAG: diguanylate cyclase [Candidatus Saelkia tenebricola]|nr:diguanylate cyclase [Candidatus Saelkia tenebricola]
MKIREMTKGSFSQIFKVLQMRIHDLHDLSWEQKEIEDLLRNSESQYRMTLDSMADAIHVVDRDLRIVLLNKTFIRWIKMLGLETDVLNRSVFQVFPFLEDKIRKEYQEVFKTGKVLITHESNKLKNRDIVTETRKIPIIENGQTSKVVTVVKNITKFIKTEKALKEAERDKSLILNSIFDQIIYHDLDMRIIWANREAANSVNLSPDELVNRHCYEVWHQRTEICENCPIIKIRDTGLPQEGEMQTPDGRTWYIKGYPVKDETGSVSGIVEVVLDITKRKSAEQQLAKINNVLLKSNQRMRQIALRDSYTGLYNHRYLEEVIESEFHRAKRYGSSLSVIIADIDYFKSINEAYGHQFGDLVLKQLARQFKKTVRRYDIVVRFGGEEFIVLSPETDRATAIKLAQRILNTVNLYDFGNKKHTVKLNLSMSVVSYPQDRVIKGRRSVKIISEGVDLINFGDKILNKVKEAGGHKVYSSMDVGGAREQTSYSKGEEAANTQLLKGKIEKLTKQANQSLIESVFAFAKTIELKDHYTGEHVERTVQYAMEIADALFLSREEVENVRQAAILHDLGKIGVSEEILHKKSMLTKKEFDVIKTHPQIGVDIIRSIHMLHDLIPSILYHHERWDGKGYPGGLKEEEIPLGARIVALADVYQALISDRPYRKAYSKEDAVKIILDGSGTQFDPKISDVFLKLLKQE